MLPRLQFALNTLIRAYPAYHRTHEHTRDGLDGRKPGERLLSGAIRRAGSWNMRPSSVPPMDEELRRRLDRLFERENHGLSTLVGKDLRSLWRLEV
jgi:hypothetical protein